MPINCMMSPKENNSARKTTLWHAFSGKFSTTALFNTGDTQLSSEFGNATSLCKILPYIYVGNLNAGWYTDAGADTNAVSTLGTALDVAECEGYSEMSRILREAGERVYFTETCSGNYIKYNIPPFCSTVLLCTHWKLAYNKMNSQKGNSFKYPENLQNVNVAGSTRSRETLWDPSLW